MKCFSRAAFLFLLCISLIALAIAGGGSRAALNAGQRAPQLFSDAADASSSHVYTLDVDDPQKTVVAGFDFANLDRSVSACQDFNQFASGGWMAKNPVPGAYSVWGRFTQLDEQNINVLHDILEGLLKKQKLASGNEQKIADYYASCMDEPKIELEGGKPLEPEMQRIAQISDVLTLADEIANLHVHRSPAELAFGANPDATDTS